MCRGGRGAFPAATPTPNPAATSAAQTPPRNPPLRLRPHARAARGRQAIAKPDTGDAGADDYAYVFRLWEAKLYPEAAQQLTMFVAKYPRHVQISYGRNLLGRAISTMVRRARQRPGS